MFDKPNEWHLSMNQTGWHLALTTDGLVKLRPHQSAPHDSARLYPGMLGAWKWFTQDGSLRPEYQDLPVFKHRNYQ
jgi:hypothetical protein